MPVTGKTISYKRVIENVYRNFKFNYDLDHMDALEWIGSLMGLLGVPIVLEDKIACIVIEDFKGKLPDDMHSIVQTAKMTGPNGDNNPDTSDPDKVNLTPMRWSTNKFHSKFHCARTDFECTGSITYVTNQNFIKTNFENGKVAMAYKAIPTDEDGYPSIPDNESWIKAFETEIAYRIATILFIQDNMRADKFQWFERERDWYIAQARNRSLIPDIPKMESDKADWVRYIPNVNSYNEFFANMQMPEQRYNYNSAK